MRWRRICATISSKFQGSGPARGLDRGSGMLGDKIREARKRRGITLNQLAEESGLTASYISQAERNLTEPSLSSLRRLAAALQLPLYFFLDEDAPQTQVIRADQRRKLALPDSNLVYEYLSPVSSLEAEAPMLEVILMRLDAKCWSREDYVRHDTAEECITVLSGVLTVDCLHEEYRLYEGDSIYIRRGIPHKVYNPGSTEAAALMCLTPPVH